MRLHVRFIPTVQNVSKYSSIALSKRFLHSSFAEISNKKPIFITTPIFYVNSVPHIGHLYSAVLADVLARWYRFKGHDVVFTTGTDEHGLKVQQAAMKNKKETQQFCDEVSIQFKNLFKRANISYTDFIRTTEPRHHKTVTAVWEKLQKNGYIYKGHHEGWYSVSDEAFCAESDVEERVDPGSGTRIMVSKESGHKVEWMKEDNYKFKLSAFQDNLLTWLQSTPSAIYPIQRLNETKSLLSSSHVLQDLSVSRPKSRVQWGIQVPGDENQVIYVWLDALVNYLTVLGYPWNEDKNRHMQKWWPADVHVVGKDIIKFHAIYWPTFLLALGLPLPNQILAHAHWTISKTKMSKSLGNVVNPFEVIDKFGVDAVRWYLVGNGGVGDDGDYSTQTLLKTYKKELSSNLGNLYSRATSTSLNPECVVPTPFVNHFGAEEKKMLKILDELPDQFAKYIQNHDYSKSVSLITQVLGDTNKYFQAAQPWTLVGAPTSAPDCSSSSSLNSNSVPNQVRLANTIFITLETIRVCSLLLQPVIPSSAGTLLDWLNVSKEHRNWEDTRVGCGWELDQHNEGRNKELARVERGVIFPKLQ
ncbi:tRNA synthetases class I (M)-domain-containing protein [Paraphysoderma sedebokerense]|nr:tRNA synthetases class I (M)-domain-containing protein [Paraphysoderma sedebokerense]